MRYFLRAVEVKTGFSFEQEVLDREEYEKLKQRLEKQGYADFDFDEGWDNLEEMYQTLERDSRQAENLA